jgi:poly(A) polymerase
MVLFVADALLDEVRPLAERFRAAGHRLYLVGGVVRDQLLGRDLGTGVDLDLTTDATPGEIKRLVAPIAEAVWTQGERFGTIGCLVAGRELEITTHRGESYEPHSRKPAVVFADAVELDLERRDFTVNAMAVSLPDGALIDPFDGAGDLAAHRLRTPLTPIESFRDDPLRMLRAARFVAGYGLVPDDALVDAVAELAPRMAIVSVERRRDELDKLLVVADPAPGLRFLVDHGLATIVLPELVDAPPDARERMLGSLHTLPRDPVLRLAAVVSLGDRDPRALRHRLRAGRHSNAVVDRVVRLVTAADLVWRHEADWEPADVRRFAAVAGDDLDRAVLLSSTLVAVDDVEVAVAQLGAREDLHVLEPALDGDDVVALLGVPPGPIVGEALGFLRELRITEGIVSADEARRRLGDWWRSRR